MKARSDLKTRHYPESRFGGFSDIDGTVVFYSRVNALLLPDSVVLDVGCGRGEYSEDEVEYRRKLRILKGKCKAVMGIDVDAAGKENPCLDEFRQMQDDDWPVESESIDLCLCDHVLEHVQDVDRFFTECRRVLKTGGLLFIRTPNAFSYFGLLSRLIPGRHHRRVLKKVQSDRKEEDVFPTVYRCNSERKLRAALRRFGFDACVYSRDAEPAYLAFSGLAYFFGVLHQRFMPRPFKTVLLAFGNKKTES